MVGETEVPLAHGYTVAQLGHVARKAGFTSRWLYLTLAERIDIARFAITEHLLTCTEVPEFWDLVHLGERAIGAHVEAEGRYRGVYLAESGKPMGAGMPRFWRYWLATAQPTRCPEAPIVEARALTQIWPRLSRPTNEYCSPWLSTTTTDSPQKHWVASTTVSCPPCPPPGNSSYACGMSTRLRPGSGDATAATPTPPVHTASPPRPPDAGNAAARG